MASENEKSKNFDSFPSEIYEYEGISIVGFNYIANFLKEVWPCSISFLIYNIMCVLLRCFPS